MRSLKKKQVRVQGFMFVDFRDSGGGVRRRVLKTFHTKISAYMFMFNTFCD